MTLALPHSQRAHAKLSPSSAHRWMECPGSIRASEGIPNKSSAFADEGTAAHELAALCLANGYNAERFEGYYVDIDAGEGDKVVDVMPEASNHRLFEITDEMVDAVQLYLDTIRADFQPGDEMDVEYRFDLQGIAPDMFGTGDCVLYKPDSGKLYVYDFKYGRGVAVAPTENPQLMLYGLGAINRHGNRPLSSVTLVIVQPRCASAKHPVSCWTTDAVSMIEFADKMKDAADLTTRPDAPLRAGEWCRFCPAAAICDANREHVRNVAGLNFEEAGSDPAHLSPDELSQRLEEAEIVEAWANRLRQYAHDQAMAGNAPSGWKLVEKRATRKWRDEQEAASWLMDIVGVDKNKVFELKMLSPAQLEKFAPGKNKESRASAMAGFVTKQSSGLVLVPATDKRPSATQSGGSFADMSV